jgi:hypothetical protein
VSNTKQLANLSEHAYKDLPLGVNPFGKDTEVNIKGKNYYVLEHASNPKTGYQGTIYQDISTREIIVAHRGTEPKSGKDLQADGQMLRGDNMQITDAMALTQKAIGFVNQWNCNPPNFNNT